VRCERRLCTENDVLAEHWDVRRDKLLKPNRGKLKKLRRRVPTLVLDDGEA
jgi:hypothetical protein